MPNPLDRCTPGQTEEPRDASAGAAYSARHFYSRRIPADAAGVRLTLTSVSDSLSGLGLPPSDRRSIELVLAEVLNNIVEHAYSGQAQGQICLRMRRWQGGVAVMVLDAGRALPGGILPCGRTADPALGRMNQPEGGFGWFVIREFTARVRYRRLGHRNHLRLVFEPQAATADKPSVQPGHWKSR